LLGDENDEPDMYVPYLFIYLFLFWRWEWGTRRYLFIHSFYTFFYFLFFRFYPHVSNLLVLQVQNSLERKKQRKQENSKWWRILENLCELTNWTITSDWRPLISMLLMLNLSPLIL
jgi:hypothetical protein